MKALFSRILLSILIASQIATGQYSVQSREQRVEIGLLPVVLIKGTAGWTLKERMKHYKVPGVSIAVINDFKVEWAKGYGVEDLDTNKAVTAGTLFQAGSISKSVAAMAALKKVEQGKISIDEDINNKLTSWKLPDNEFTSKKKVTLAHLLSHSGGLTVHGFPGYAVGEKTPTLPQVLDGTPPANTAAVRVDMEPGTKYRYSGGGTTIAQLTIMDIEKKPYPQIAQENVLTPLGMTDSTYEQPLPEQIRKKAASGYRANGKVVDGKIHVYPEMAAAGLWTTPTDLARFAIEVQLSLQGRSNKILSKASAEKMVTPFIEGSGGLGFFAEKHGNAMYFGHGGADEGFRAQLLVHRDNGYGVAVMVNSDNGAIINEIIRSVAKEYRWEDYSEPYEAISLDPTKLNGYAGRFLVNPDRVLTVAREGGKLYAQPTGEPRFEMVAISESVFIRTDQNIRYTFLRNASDKVEAVKIRFGVGETHANLISKETLIPYEMVMAGKTDEAIEAYKKVRNEKPTEARVNQLGYAILAQKKVAEAIAIFRANVEMYPNSSNVYDSLGEAYMVNGDKELARLNYKKSLELDPQNRNAMDMLKKLEP